MPFSAKIAPESHTAHAGATAAYIHVPFCLHRCGYCDFTVIAGREDLIGTYLDCLELELQQTLSEPRPVRTLFIGGGTPSLLPADALRRLFQILNEWLPIHPEGEFSIECNPEQFSSDRMDELSAAGVNRVSLGVQSFQEEHLKTLERGHTAQTVTDVVGRLRERGLENISLDLIFAVPGQTLDDWEKTLQTAVALQPRHISTYGLTYEKGTAFWTRKEKGTLAPANDELERQMYDRAMTLLPERGYRQYELSNFSQPGWESRHNQVYWHALPYWGFGPGAAGYVAGTRTLNHRSVTTWIKRLQAGESPIQETETLDADLQCREAVMLGLRLIEGMNRQEFQSRFHRDIPDLAPEAMNRFEEQGWLETTPAHVRLTREGRFVADTVVSEFL